MAKTPDISETQAATKGYLRAWRTLNEIAENFGVTNLSARNRVKALENAGVKLESRVREMKRTEGQVGRAPMEYRIATASADASEGKASKGAGKSGKGTGKRKGKAAESTAEAPASA